jgi:hypothetical protein
MDIKDEKLLQAETPQLLMELEYAEITDDDKNRNSIPEQLIEVELKSTPEPTQPNSIEISSDLTPDTFLHAPLLTTSPPIKDGGAILEEIPPTVEYLDPIFTCGLSDKQQWILGALFLALICTFIPLLSIRNQITSDIKMNNFVHGKINPLDPPPSFNGILIFANVTRIEHHNLSCTIRYSFYPVGTYQSAKTEQFSRNVKFYTERYHTTIFTHEFDPVAEVTYPIVGLPVKYPFETYWSHFTISLYTDDDKPVPFAIGIIASKQSWWGNAELQDIGEQMTIALRFDQGWTTKLFAIFSSLIMWILTITLIAITWTIFVNNGIAERSVMRLGMRFLIAFPVIRRNQPQVVPMGSTEDVLSFFWCIGLVSFCMYLLILNVCASFINEEITDDKRMYLPTKPTEAGI